MLNWCRAHPAPLAAVSLGTAVGLEWRRRSDALQEQEKEPDEEQHPGRLAVDGLTSHLTHLLLYRRPP